MNGNTENRPDPFISCNKGWYPGIYEGKPPGAVESEVGTNVMDSTKGRNFIDRVPGAPLDFKRERS